MSLKLPGKERDLMVLERPRLDGKAVRFIPTRRAGRPDEVDPLAVYLASDASGHVTGQTFFVDGGLTVHL